MSDARKRTFAEALNTWLQIIAILAAACWAVGTFVFKEILVPKSAPINITMNLQLKKVGTGDVKKSLLAIEMHVSATNPSSRRVYLLPAAWVVYGYTMAPANKSLDLFNRDAASLMSAQKGQSLLRYATPSRPAVVAAGSLFADRWLNPSETLDRTIIFYVPRKQYDALTAQTVMPSIETKSGIELQWNLDETTGLEPSLNRVGPDGKHTPMTKNTEGEYSDEHTKLQMARSSSALSLRE